MCLLFTPELPRRPQGSAARAVPRSGMAIVVRLLIFKTVFTVCTGTSNKFPDGCYDTD